MIVTGDRAYLILDERGLTQGAVQLIFVVVACKSETKSSDSTPAMEKAGNLGTYGCDILSALLRWFCWQR